MTEDLESHRIRMESRERGLRHGRQFVDFFGRQREVKNVQIFLLMREKRRLRDRGDAALNAPPQSDLGRRLAVGGSDLFEQRMAQERPAAERTPGLNLNALGTAEIDGGRLRIARMNFELIHHRFYAGTGKQRNEVMGEVLCMVSAPTYDPSILIGRQRGKNYVALQKDPLKPLFNRPLMAQYPPGSTFKPTQGLIFLQEGVITPETQYTCAHGYTFRGGKPACHGHPSPLNLVGALATSCNSFFPWGLHDMIDSRKRYPSVQEAFEVWKNYMVSMGYGYKLGIDLPGEKRGFIPNSKFYDKVYRGRWNSSTVISIAIGQGEILATPLQICNLAATVANRGYYITPHVVKEIQDTPLDTLYSKRHYTSVDTHYYSYIAEGMRGAVTGTAYGGTCRGAALPDIEVCGKTGTSENPHGKDHSIFMGFAPYQKPKVAIAVFVENAGFGATYAVPIGKLMLEKYLKGEISEANKATEEYIMNAVILPNNAL